MSDNVKATFQGLDELTRRMQAVGAASKLVFRAAARAGGKVVQEAANANAPGPHIGLEVQTESATRAVASVGPKHEKWFYRFREFGTRAHGPSGSKMMRWFQNGRPVFRRKVAGISARPFLQPAIQHVDEITAAVGAVYQQAIERAIQ